MEEIAYVPSPSGYYNNLIVKGDVYINNLVSDTFRIRSYSSIFTLEIPDTSTLYINNIEVSHRRGSVFLSESKFDVVNNITNSITGMATPWPTNSKGGEGGDPKAADSSIPIEINGGTISISNVPGENSTLSLRTIKSNINIPNATVFTNNISDTNSPPIYVKNLTIFGMDIPKCPYNYYWQKVKVGDDVYTVLACNTTTCSNPEKEEYCIQNNQCWSSASCSCIDCATIPPGGGDD